MPKVNTQFGEEVKNRLNARGWSHQRACVATGIPAATIGRMALGIIPGKDHVIDWAQALNEDINVWLQIAGYDPIPPKLVCREKPYPTLNQLQVHLRATGMSEEVISVLLKEIEKIESGTDF